MHYHCKLEKTVIKLSLTGPNFFCLDLMVNSKDFIENSEKFAVNSEIFAGNHKIMHMGSSLEFVARHKQFARLENFPQLDAARF